jgi:hypothetical protein
VVVVVMLVAKELVGVGAVWCRVVVVVALIAADEAGGESAVVADEAGRDSGRKGQDAAGVAVGDGGQVVGAHEAGGESAVVADEAGRDRRVDAVVVRHGMLVVAGGLFDVDADIVVQRQHGFAPQNTVRIATPTTCVYAMVFS